jgi:hypothetical protein
MRRNRLNFSFQRNKFRFWRFSSPLINPIKAKIGLNTAFKAYFSVLVSQKLNTYLNGVDHWFTFLAVPDVEPTNNRAERALRKHVVQRKIMGTFRNGKDTKIYETVMTMLAIWKQRGRNMPQTLAETLTKEWTKS